MPGRRKEQGKYKLNKTGWELYDPIFSLHRTLLLRNMENSKMNYVHQMQEDEKDTPDGGSPPAQNKIYGIPFPPLPTDVAKQYFRLEL